MARAQSDIPRRRLHNQFITRRFKGTPAALVSALGAVQGQEYPFAKWALGLRLGRAARDAAIEAAIDAGEILRTHVMRPTWHLVAADDIAWMQALTGPRVHPILRRQGLELRTFTRATAIIERALADGHYRTRPELRTVLEHAGISLAPREMSFVAIFAELEGVICSGPRREKAFTYALVSERAPNRRTLSRDEALEALTRRFFSSHGPATVRDFVWWSGLKVSDARRGLDMIAARSLAQDGLTYWTAGAAPEARRSAAPTVHLLPIYDEYLVAYRDRLAVPHGPGSIARLDAASVTFQHAVVIDGRVAGTWRVDRTRSTPAVRVTTLRRLVTAERRALEAAAERYGRFTGISVSLSIG